MSLEVGKVAQWLWDPAAAAWLQVGVAAVAIWYAGSRGNKTMRDIRSLIGNRTKDQVARNLHRFAFTINLIVIRLTEFIEVAEEEDGVDEIDIEMLKKVFTRCDKNLTEIMFGELPQSAQFLRDILLVADAINRAQHGLDLTIEEKVVPQLGPYRDTRDELRDYERKLRLYVHAYERDASTTWKDIHPGDTGLGPEGPVE